jgi:hypothetical protein
MKRITALALLMLMLVFAGTLSATKTSASPISKAHECEEPQNPPPPGTPCEPWLFSGCDLNEEGQLVEIYVSRGCQGVTIHRPVN